MCGVLAIACADAGLIPDDRVVARMLDRLVHRGPDGRGVVRFPFVTLGHTRLSVIDRGEGGRQPMGTPDGRCALSYNGELYNDEELRRELSRRGYEFRSSCDSETVLAALATWGEAALERFRGMYALAFYDALEGTLLLARDPMGIKPLHVWRGWTRGGEGPCAALIACSEITAMLAHPDVRARPDRVGVEAYLSTIRSTIGRRTMFEGIETLLAGESIVLDVRAGCSLRSRRVRSCDGDGERPASLDEVREEVERSVRIHLRSDADLCCMLSGGVDSSIIAHTARRELAGPLVTFCAGSTGEDASPDFAFARGVASRIGSEHHEVGIDRGLFIERWREMIDVSASVLSTPNEVAIGEVARAMRERGMVVTLSGEGADELFGGYGDALSACDAIARGSDPGVEMLRAFAWMDPAIRASVLREGWARGPHAGEEVASTYRAIWDACVDPARDHDPIVFAMRFLRRVNLEGLLRRLDVATMRWSIEGRTPLADVTLAGLADGLAGRARWTPQSPGKIALREAFRGVVGDEIADRPKASFPLPFARWIGGTGEVLRRSPFAREVFSEAAIESVARDPSAAWRLAWPMLNVAMWGDRWLA